MKGTESPGAADRAAVSAVDAAGRAAALLAAVELGLGSVLHAFRVPFGGHFLALNQAFMLSRSVLAARGLPYARFLPASVSNVTAVLKSLSPAGKKLSPMLAISAQGLLFSGGTSVLGPNRAGTLLGSALLSVWPFVHPVLIYFILFGRTLVDVADYYLTQLHAVFGIERSQLLWVLGALVAAQLLLSQAVVILAWRLPEARVRRYQEKLLRAGKSRRAALVAGARDGAAPAGVGWRRAFRLAFGDLRSPVFLVSFVLTGLFFYFSERANASRLIWGLLRPLAVGFALFFLVRMLPFERLFTRLERGRWSGFGKSLRVAVRLLKEI